MLGRVAGACPDLGLLSHHSRAGHRPKLLLELQRLHVTHVVRKLHVGDFVWLAQETRPRDPARPGELVLDHIVERKRLDDLCSSIVDGRFQEQKVPRLASPCSPFPVHFRAPPQPRGVLKAELP